MKENTRCGDMHASEPEIPEAEAGGPKVQSPSAT